MAHHKMCEARSVTRTAWPTASSHGQGRVTHYDVLRMEASSLEAKDLGLKSRLKPSKAFWTSAILGNVIVIVLECCWAFGRIPGNIR
ncbi:hypothetical protein L6452_39016 [Arctium lappa]|uniref:Uncharacterized protein n=1 Tax=Arctium lappa TaxID=4217 RepID=A0ACB8XRD7_ARCLA|nr:hypothetical protein L6452_39016 [Arctium lappa]